MTRAPSAQLQTNSGAFQLRLVGQRKRADSSAAVKFLRSDNLSVQVFPWVIYYRSHRSFHGLAAEALSNQIRQFDEKGAAIAVKPVFRLARERIGPVEDEVIVVADVERSTRIR